MIYHSQTYGDLEIDNVCKCIASYMKLSKDNQYEVIIGTDSQKKNGGTDFVTAIIVRRIGLGGIYFWSREYDRKRRVLKQRMFEEATRSLVVAQELLDLFKQNGIRNMDFVIHVDIGTKGPTRDMISEIVSMVRGSGFEVKTKPDGYGASKVADRHT